MWGAGGDGGPWCLEGDTGAKADMFQKDFLGK